MALPWRWIIPSVLVVVLAFLAQNPSDSSRNDNSQPNQPQSQSTTTSSQSTTTSSSVDDPPSEPTTPTDEEEETKGSVWVIGDTHGDELCARHWVNKTGLIDAESGQWMDEDQHLVFLGDYVDKGPQSKQTCEFVKSLTDQFPNHVTAIMGNHEMELLLDRDTRRHRVFNGAYYQLAYSSVHPGEYRNYLPVDVKNDEQDELIIEALYNASIEVYGHGQHRDARVSATAADDISILQYVKPELRELVKERLPVFQKHYIDTFRSGTELGDWLEKRPVVALVQDTLFVHGGISGKGAGLIKAAGSVDGVNQMLQDHATEDKLLEFIQETEPGRAVYDMLTFRGNHQRSACPYLPQLLQPAGAKRLGVGHTPGDSVRLLCEQKFLALDSALGRWFRNSGNDYCPGEKRQSSSNGRYQCEPKREQCEGQIVRIDAKDGSIHVIHAD